MRQAAKRSPATKQLYERPPFNWAPLSEEATRIPGLLARRIGLVAMVRIGHGWLPESLVLPREELVQRRHRPQPYRHLGKNPAPTKAIPSAFTALT
jgi:hypothetical protein